MSIRAEYEKLGVVEFYRRYGSHYRNPHASIVSRIVRAAVAEWKLDLSHVLDLACGSGELTVSLRALGDCLVHGVDPYTSAAYQERTGTPAEVASFEQVAAGSFRGRRYSLIACSYALHLVELSRLPGLIYALSEIGDHLLVITPHKRPALKREWGWTLRGELMVERVRARYYSVNTT